MKIISAEGNDRLNYGWLAVLRWTCSVCCLQEGRLWVQSDGEHRARAGHTSTPRFIMSRQRWGPHKALLCLKGTENSLPHPLKPLGTAGRVVLLVPVFGQWMSRERCCLHWYLLPVLWSSAVMLLFIRLIPVIWFFVFLCVCFYI